MSGQKRSKSGFLKARFKSFTARLKRDSSPSGTQPTPSPRLSPLPDPVAPSVPSAGPNSAAASNVSVVPASESWWSKNREEIVASVRQVLNVAKEVLEAVPVHGLVLKVAVGGLTESLRVFQTKWGNDESLIDLKEEIEHVFAIVRPYISPDSNVPVEMAKRMRKLAKSISGLEEEWVKQTSKNIVRQHLSAELIAEDLKGLTRKLTTSIGHTMLESSLNIEATVMNIASKQATANKDHQYKILQGLAPITSAFHNAAGSPPSGCLKDTRVDLLAQIDDWLDDESATRPRVLWLNGLAGTGKTTIARSVAAAAEERKMLAASFFFSRDHRERRRLASIVPTIAFQLALWRDELRGPISEAVSEKPNIANQLMTEQVDTLLVRSFEKNPIESNPPCALLILDALDECDKDKGTEGGDLLPLLIKSLDKIPFPVKIFLTSRPEHSINMMLHEPEMCGPTDVVVLHAVDAGIVAADIRLYLTSEFKDVARRRMPHHNQAWPAQHEIDALVALATPLFVFASTAIKFIDSSAFPPRRQLGLILHSDATERPVASFHNLDRLYMDVLRGIIADQSEVDVICGRFRRIMGAILSALEPASVALLSSLLPMDEEEVEYALRPLSAVLDIPAYHDPDYVVRIFHPSFLDFMTHPERCDDHRFFINTRESHALLAQSCLATFTECLSTTQGGSRNGFASSNKLDYAHSYWLSHLVSSLSPSPKYEVSEHLQASPDAFCVSAIMRFLASGDKGPTSHATTGKMSFILRDIAQHSHVVVLYMKDDHCAAAIIPQSSRQLVDYIHVLRLPHLNQDQMSRVLFILDRVGSPDSDDAYGICSSMWYLVVQPVISVLKLEPRAGRDRPRIHWCPLGQTSILPLHLAKDDSAPSSTSYAVSSYVPNLAALLALQGATQAWTVSDLRTCVAYISHDADGYAKGTGLEEEAVLVASILSQPEEIVIPTKSVQEALDLLTSSHIFHYVGFVSWERRLMDRAFELDSQLKICDINHAPLRHPVLAYLAQSEAGGEDVLGPATGMLLSGFKSVLMPMWELYDTDESILPASFYRSWLANGHDGLVNLQDIPYALDDACAVIRASCADPYVWGPLVHIGA